MTEAPRQEENPVPGSSTPGPPPGQDAHACCPKLSAVSQSPIRRLCSIPGMNEPIKSGQHHER